LKRFGDKNARPIKSREVSVRKSELITFPTKIAVEKPLKASRWNVR